MDYQNTEPMQASEIAEMMQSNFSSFSENARALPLQEYAWIGFLILVICTIFISIVLTYHWKKYELEKIKHVGIQLVYYIGVIIFLMIIGITLITF